MGAVGGDEGPPTFRLLRASSPGQRMRYVQNAAPGVSDPARAGPQPTLSRRPRLRPGSALDDLDRAEILAGEHIASLGNRGESVGLGAPDSERSLV